MRYKNIGHISFNVRDMERMLRFYCDILGMERYFTLTFSEMVDFARDEMLKGIQFAPVEQINRWQEFGDQPCLEFLKMSDSRYMELYHNTFPRESLEGRNAFYGYQKFNFEVEDIYALHSLLIDKGVEGVGDVVETADHSLEVETRDPDGNRVLFVQYTEASMSKLGIRRLEREERKTAAPICISQVAFQIKHSKEMKKFYCDGLGMKCAYSMSVSEMLSYLEKKGFRESDVYRRMRERASTREALVDYIEVVPHQYIEFFHTDGVRQDQPQLDRYYGYQHICLEVEDIREAWSHATERGIKPFTPILWGPDKAWRFWVKDPDGNKLEIMQY